MQPDWTGVSIDDIPVKFGQVLQFSNDTIQLKAIVLDFDEDEGGKWVGLCFIHNNQLFGRQIPGGMMNTTCLDIMDLTYIQTEALNDYIVIEAISVNKNKLGIGMRSPATSTSEIIRDYQRGIEQRKKEQTPCDKIQTDLNPVRECYFDIEKIKY